MAQSGLQIRRHEDVPSFDAEPISDQTPRFYDPSAPLDKALPEAISAHGLKRDAAEPRVSAPSRVTTATFDIASRVLRDLGVSSGEIEAARKQATAQGTDIGRELVAAGRITDDQFADAIAKVLGLPREPILPGDRIVPSEAADAIATGRRRAGPPRLLKTCGGLLRTKLFLAPRLEDLGEIGRILERWGERAGNARIATTGAISRHLASASCAERERAARLSLSGERPDVSARHVLTGLQGMTVAAAVMTLAILALIVPGAFFATAHLVVIPVYLGAIGLRLAATATVRPAVDAPPIPEEEEMRPVYSVLVALYRESEMAGDLVASLSALSWPRSKLEVMLVCEGDDPETIAACRRAVARQPGFTVVAVPPSLPRTKPKALNYALPLATGEFVVLYDAEDRPHPDQLEAAFRAMRAGGPDLACLQAPLIVRNGARHWLAAHFALEYAALFRGMLPLLARLRLPLPLGGTSNHFRRATLVEVGAWDSHNVTEDADLGIRLCRRGFRVGTIGCPTFEDAPERWRDWRNQRTRWMKGWLQTWLVHMRHPGRLLRDLGPRGFLALQLVFFGMVASTLVHPFFLGVLAYAAWSAATSGLPDAATRLLIAIDLAALLLGYLAFALLALRTLDSEERRSLSRHLWTLTGYWCLISLASARAFGQLVTDPHHWEKTPHGPSARAAVRKARDKRPGWSEGFA